MKRVSVAEAKAHLSELMAEVAYGGQRVLIERRGRPLAALVSSQDLGRLEEEPASPKGLLAAVGAWRDLGSKKIDQLVAEIYAQREQDTGRSVDLEA